MKRRNAFLKIVRIAKIANVAKAKILALACLLKQTQAKKYNL